MYEFSPEDWHELATGRQSADIRDFHGLGAMRSWRMIDGLPMIARSGATSLAGLRTFCLFFFDRHLDLFNAI